MYGEALKERTEPMINDQLQLTDEQPIDVDVNQLDTAQPMIIIFKPFQTVLEKWEAKSSALVVTDISQKAEMKMARAARLEIRDARLALEVERKSRVEHLKARSSKIDAAARTVRVKLEALEETFRESEQFAARWEAKLKLELKIKREAEITPFLDSPIIGDLSVLSEEQYQSRLADAKLLRQAKIDAAAKLEADRLAKEAADKAERERIAAENARLKAEADATAKRLEEERKAREAQAAKERAEQARKDREAQEKLQAEQDAREIERKKAQAEVDRLRKELEAKSKAEAAEQARIEVERKAKAKADRIAAAAPNKAKLAAYADEINIVPIPAFTDADLRLDIEQLRDTFTHQIMALTAAISE